MVLVRQVIVAAVVAASALGGASAWAGQDGFMVDNQSLDTIVSIRLSPSGHNDWSEDLLGRDTLERYQRMAIAFAPQGQGCLFDLGVSYDGDDFDVAERVDLCRGSEVRIFYHLRWGTLTVEVDEPGG